MNFIITENKMIGVVSKFMSNKFDKLTPFKSKIFPVGIFYVDNHGKIFAEVINNKHSVGVILDWEIWCEVSDVFGFETIRKQSDVLSKWANHYFGFENSAIDFREFVETIDDL